MLGCFVVFSQLSHTKPSSLTLKSQRKSYHITAMNFWVLHNKTPMKAVKALRQHNYEMKLNNSLSMVTEHHPFLALLVFFVLFPVLLLLVICASVCLVALPLGEVLGWF